MNEFLKWIELYTVPFGLVGLIETFIVGCGIILAIGLCISTIFPFLYRLGYGKELRKLTIFAKKKNIDDFVKILYDSNLFYKTNIREITNKDELCNVGDSSIYLVFWEDWGEEISEIVAWKEKKNNCALIIFAPPKSIPEDQMNKLVCMRNTAITNFRGRLVNDIVTAMITTSYHASTCIDKHICVKNDPISH